MILHDVEQRSEAWHALRLGIPTASRFGDILTARGDLRTGETPKKYAAELVAERILGVPTQRQGSA